MTTAAMRGVLVLEDGTVFRGHRFGHDGDAEGEVIFVTCMTGYQEICTDPSYHGQMVVFTYPLIGNYGINSLDVESRKPWAAAVIIREYCDRYSNWQAEGELDEYLRKNKVPGLMGVDTRALTRHLRDRGTMRAVIADARGTGKHDDIVRRARAVTSLSDKPLVQDASPSQHYTLADGNPVANVAVIDCDIKQNILRSLNRGGVATQVFPFDATAEQILAVNPDGVLFSNGPGDPATLPDTVQCAKGLIWSGLPVMGICLGHQIIGQAIGGTTSRLKFGHHGGNHPVLDLDSQRVHITSQNHEFQVDAGSIPEESGFYVHQVNLNDRSVEGLAHRELPVFSVQYHPEGAPGPQDNQYIFEKFISMLGKRNGK